MTSPHIPKGALELKASCPICGEETITCWFWSNYDDYYGAWEGDGTEAQSCQCDLSTEDENGDSWSLFGICESEWDNYCGQSQQDATGGE